MIQSYVLFRTEEKNLEILENCLLKNSGDSIKNIMTMYDTCGILARFVTKDRVDFLSHIDHIEEANSCITQVIFTGG